MNILLIFITLAFILIAVVLFIQQIYLWDVALLLSLAMITSIITLLRNKGSHQSLRHDLKRLMPKSIRAWLRLVPALISLLVAIAAKAQPLQSDFTLLFLLWLVAVITFCVSLIDPWIRLRDNSRRMTKSEWFVLIALMTIAAVCRGASLGQIPANLGGDEGTQLLLGANLVTPPFGNPFATGWFSVPTMSFALYGLAMRFWGTTMAGGRILSVIIGTCTVLLTYLLGRSMGGRRFAWVAALCVAFSAYHIHYSRLASNQIFDPFIGTLAFWLIWTALKDQSKDKDRALYAWGLAGVVAGFGWYAYFGARWVTFLIGLLLFWRWIFNRNLIRAHVKGLLLFALGWGIVIMPLLGWYSEHPSALTERYNAVSIFASGWLSREVVIMGKTAVQLMFEQFWKSATAFHLTPDPTFWYYPERPLLDIITGLLMLLGLLSCFRKGRWPAKALTLLWFWSTLVMAWVITENPPSSQRGLLLVPAAAFFAAWGFEMLWSRPSVHKRFIRSTLILLLGVSVILNLGFYFGVYTPKRSYGNPTAEIATRVAQYTLSHPMPVCEDVQSAQCDGRVYFIGPPQLYWQFGSMAFLLQHFPGQDVMPGRIPTDFTGPARFILVQDRIGEIDALMQAYPGGEVVSIQDRDARTIALIYDWP